MSQSIKPKYLSSNPIGKDLFEGRSHEKISDTIFNLITNKSLPNNIIGLEGKWGSGKSNIISILEAKLKTLDSDYFFFTYDAWGHQEDLTRRTFLEELISKLKTESKFKGNIDWQDELKKLLAKKSKTSTERYPKIKFYWIALMASIFLFTFLDVVYEDFLANTDLIANKTFPVIKPFVSKYLFPLILFLYGLNELRKEYLSFDLRSETKNLEWKERLKRLLYIFSGSDLETEEFEHKIEEEPSVKNFKDYFEKIRNDLKSEGLIIVFDNMDRLSDSKKVLSLWSSIHTFFAEEHAENIWVIIPYDKGHLASHFNDEKDELNKLENFIGKTFSTVFRVSPPVLSDWRRFFLSKLKESFKDVITKEEMEFIASLYEMVVNVQNRKPRDIITYINNLVSLYLQHNNSIQIKYLALFALRANQILDNPLVSISGKEFLKTERYLFSDTSELEANLAAIVYNVDTNKSGEVLLKNNIEDLLIRYDLETLKSVKKHNEFPTYFDKIFQTANVSSYKSEVISNFLDEVEDVITISSMKRYWEKFSSDILSKENGSFETFEEWHKRVLENVSISSGKNVADRIASSCAEKFESSHSEEEDDCSDYYQPVFELLKFLKGINSKVVVKVEPVEFTPGQLFNYLVNMHQEFDEENYGYKQLKITANSSKLHDYLTVEKESIEFWGSFLHIIQYLIKNEKSFKTNEFKKHFGDVFSAIPYNQKEDLINGFKIAKGLSLKKTKIKLLPENTGNQYLNTFRNAVEKPYLDIISNQIGHLGATKSPANNYLIVELNRSENSQEIAERIQYYTTYGNLLKLSVINSNRNYPLLKDIVKSLTKNSFGFSRNLDVTWVYKNIELIKSILYPENIGEFLTEFDAWSRFFADSVSTESVFEVGTGYIELSCIESNHSYSSVNHFYNTAITKLSQIGKETWIENFDSESPLFLAFKRYIEMNLLESTITKSSEFMDAFELHLKKMAKRETALPAVFNTWQRIMIGNFLDNRKKKRIFNDFLDLILDHTEIDPKEIEFFGGGLLAHSSNLTNETQKANEFIRKAILPLENDKSVLRKLFEISLDRMVIVINKANEYKQELVELLIEAKESNDFSNELYDSIIFKTNLKRIEKVVMKHRNEKLEE